MANATIEVGIRGEYDLYIRNADGELRPAVINRKNLITNAGMDYFGSSNSIGAFAAYARLGTSSTTPAFTDTALGAQVAVTIRDVPSVASWGTGDYAGSLLVTSTFTFPAFSSSANLQEVGVSNASSSNLLTHALLTDGAGSPVTVTVGVGEQPVLIYRLVFTPPSTDFVFNTTTSPSSVAYTLTLRPMGVGSSWGDPNENGITAGRLGWIPYYGASSGIVASSGTVPTGTAGSASSPPVISTYVSGSYERSYTYSFGASTSNYASIGALATQGAYPSPIKWQLGISPRLTKVSPEILSFTIKMKWART